MNYLSSIEFTEGQGQHEGVMLKDNQGIVSTMMTYTWMNRDRCYFISTASSLSEGKLYQHIRWRQQELDLNLSDNEDRGNNEDPIRQEPTVPQPKCSEIYYDVCAAIDEHNRYWQDTLRIEHKIETKSWYKRGTISLFGIYVVDTWLMYKGATTDDSVHPDPELNQQDFYCTLAEELIESGDLRRNRQAGREQGSVRTNPQQQSNSFNMDLILNSSIKTCFKEETQHEWVINS